jgi:hypothetical protein
MEEATTLCSDVSLLRRILFAAWQIPKDTPKYWMVVTNFAFKDKPVKPKYDEVRLLVENTQSLDSEALRCDEELRRELIYHDGFHLEWFSFQTMIHVRCVGAIF